MGPQHFQMLLVSHSKLQVASVPPTDLSIDDRCSTAVVSCVYDGVKVLYSTSDERSERGRHAGVPSLSVADVVGSADSAHVTRVHTVRSHQTYLYRYSSSIYDDSSSTHTHTHTHLIVLFQTFRTYFISEKKTGLIKIFLNVLKFFFFSEIRELFISTATNKSLLLHCSICI